jgi:hypothetical protein
MSFSGLMGLLQKYASAQGGSEANPEHDFGQVAQAVPRQHLAGGLAEAFRSDQTPPFAQMLGTLFSNSNGQQRAGILNQLLSAAGPAAASGILGNLLGGPSNQVTPQQAQQLPPDAASRLAEEAQKRDPSIIDKASTFYAEHPQVVRTLGSESLAFIMSHLSRAL